MHGCWRNVIPEEGLGVKAIAVCMIICFSNVIPEERLGVKAIAVCMIICFSNVIPEEGLGVKEIISVSQKRNLPKSL